MGVASASPEGVLVSARGRPVSIRPAPGLCLADDAVEVSDRAAVALITDCALSTDPAGAARTARGELILPRALPGFMTVSVSAQAPLGQPTLDLDALTAFLESKDGLDQLGRAPGEAEARLLETRREGRVLYVLLEEEGGDATGMLSRTYWRAFVMLNGRLGVVTLNGFAARPMGVNEMYDILSDQVGALEAANGRTVLTAAVDDAVADQAAPVAELPVTTAPVGATVTGQPLPPRRPVAVAIQRTIAAAPRVPTVPRPVPRPG